MKWQTSAYRRHAVLRGEAAHFYGKRSDLHRWRD